MNKENAKFKFCQQLQLEKMHWEGILYYMNNKSSNTPPNGFPAPINTPQNAVKKQDTLNISSNHDLEAEAGT